MKNDNLNQYLKACDEVNRASMQFNSLYPNNNANLTHIMNNPANSNDLSTLYLGACDYLYDELSVIKVKLTSGEETFACMDNDSTIYLSKEFRIDASFYNSELLNCLPLVQKFAIKYDRENPDNKIAVSVCIGLNISYGNKITLCK